MDRDAPRVVRDHNLPESRLSPPSFVPVVANENKHSLPSRSKPLGLLPCKPLEYSKYFAP